MLSSFSTKRILIECWVSDHLLRSCIIYTAPMYRYRAFFSFFSYANCRCLQSRGSIIGEFENMPIPGKKTLASVTKLHKQPSDLSDV